MNLQEILKAKGFTDEEIKKIDDVMKENKLYTTAEENIDIRYSKLKEQNESNLNELKEAQKLIETLKKDSSSEDSLKKIKDYESTVEKLKEEINKTRAESEFKFELLNAGANDVDYLMYKAKESGGLEVDEDGKVKNMVNTIQSLKQTYKNQFKTSMKKVEENILKEREQGENSITKEEFNKMGYQERNRLYKDNVELYKKLNTEQEASK